MAPFNVLYLSPELSPFAKVGGLADVAGALPKVLKELGHDVRVLLPKYHCIRDRKYNLREVIRLREIEVPLGGEVITVSVKSGFIPDSKVQAYFLEYKPFYDRNEIYVDPETGEGWEDNDLRFALYSRAALETLKVLYWQPHLIHCNDWPCALVPFFLKHAYADDPFFHGIRTVLTIHNLGYQGIFPAESAARTGVDVIPFDENHPGWHEGSLNFLKAGILAADQITTVSPTYAKQILTGEHGAGLHEVVTARKDRITGVLNGIDTSVWNPETDPH
ncbi:MAG TPA: glycogen synthase, partial [Bacteroidetes bacterium]|nr:glycogen synthase [Bacteroidota bacterium]